jgi:hypothetical protein
VGVYIVRSGGSAGGAGGTGAVAESSPSSSFPYQVTKLSRAALRDGGAAYALRKLAEAAAAAAAAGAWPHAPLDAGAARDALKRLSSSSKREEADEEADKEAAAPAPQQAEPRDEL